MFLVYYYSLLELNFLAKLSKKKTCFCNLSSILFMWEDAFLYMFSDKRRKLTHNGEIMVCPFHLQNYWMDFDEI
jgi:hypothetical protein